MIGVALLSVSGSAGGGSSYSTNPSTYTISGTISPSSGGSGATLTLSGRATGSTTADGSGNYSFTGLATFGGPFLGRQRLCCFGIQRLSRRL